MRGADGGTVALAARLARGRTAAIGSVRDRSAVPRVKRFFLRFEENLAALCLGGLLVTLFLQVFTRFIVRDPLSWTEEVARYLYVYVVFLGSSAAVSDRSHVAIDFFVLRLPRAGRLAVALLVNLCVLFVLANLFYWGIRATLRQLNIPLVVLDIPYAWVYVVVPVTALLMTVRTAAVMGEDVRRYRQGDRLVPEVRSVV